MRFYGNQFGSSYEELISYYPRYYRDVLEMVAILNAQGKLLDDAKAQIEQNYLNNFIEYMDEAAISDLEEFLEIHNDGTKTLDERKKIVKPYFAGFGRISSTTIKEMIAAYSDATADVRLRRSREQYALYRPDLWTGRDRPYQRRFEYALQKDTCSHHV